MNAKNENHPADEAAIRLAAAGWVVRQDAGLTAAEQDEFFQWLAADPRHGAWLARQRGNWRELDGLEHWRPAHSTAANPDLLARPRRARWLAPALLATAAGLAVALGVGSFSGSPASAPGVAKAAASERRVLEDGSVVDLRGGAEVEVAYSATERRVRLGRGAALFSVEKNPARPFIVEAAGVAVRAVGTAFHVRLADAAIEVLVTEGRVALAQVERVDPNALGGLPPAAPEPARWGQRAPPPELVAGQRALVDRAAPGAAPRIEHASAEAIRAVLAPPPEVLEFASAPLARVAAEFNRHNRTQLVVADPALAALPIVASLRADNLDGFVQLLEATAGIRAERRGDREIALHARR